jgi:predicted type IV restriction endonuclease
MTAPPQVLELVERFDRNLDVYKRPDYKETRVRVEFIDPFFEALGWDVRNVQGYAEQYKDVVHEEALKVGGAARAPDYCFRIGGVRKFFLEAKKPLVSVRGDVGPAYQLRRYAWSAKLPLSILTDFEEFAVYDCRQRPKPSDKVSVGRVTYLTFDQYPDRFDDIYGVFAKESVLKGSFDRYVQEAKRKRGTGEVDAEFLKEIEGWRDALARNVALRNPDLSVHELNFAVQRTIDRVIFLRMCEDRGIEEYGRLLALTAPTQPSPAGREGGIYPRLGDLYRQADEKYDAGLFDFQADTLTRTLTIDDNALKPILTGLYYPQSPYEFSVLPPEVLGQVYEQFLGKVIRLTPSHRAKVEEKPEVKKAGGVYYTPSYIVDYIVKQTVGQLVEGKTPRQIRELRVLDPACGSGSFLLGAYQYLLDYHREWYENNDPVKHARRKGPTVYQGPRGEWRLTGAEKKRILLNNIYGVDIDRQAVEVTKLSLLLKVLEGETEETLGQQLSLWRERALPDLEDNIRCGNSLIGPDYFEAQLLPDEEEMRRVNPFDWETAFPEIMSAGGFNAVIGNPPYVRQEALGGLKTYFEQYYESYQGTADLYVYFIEKGLKLLSKGGLYSVIVSSSFLHTTFATKLRKYIRGNSAILSFVDFGGLAVFQGAKDTYVCIPLLANRTQPEAVKIAKVKSLEALDLERYVEENKSFVSPKRFSESTWSLTNQAELDLFCKICDAGIGLGEYVGKDFYRGVTTGLNKAFVIDSTTRERLIAEHPSSAELIKPLLSGQDVRRYVVRPTDRHLIFTRRGVDIDAYPAIKNYLSQYKEALKPKPKGWKGKWPGRKPGSYEWYEIQDSVDYYDVFEQAKIIYPDIAKGPRFYIDTTSAYISNTAYCLGTNDLYLLGVLNSKLFWFAIGNISIPFGTRAGKYRYRLIYQYMEQIPIRTINFDDPADVARHDKMVALVERMLELHQKLAAATIPADKSLYERQIEATDRQIDALVYELYGLSEEEIKIVEESY